MLSNTTGILFRIPAPISQQIMAWRQQLDWQVMQYQIDNHGKVLVVRYKDDRRLQIITTTPAIGEAEVWYGNVGGGYRFTFSPQPNGCELEIINMAGSHKQFYPDVFPPFTAHLSTSITLGALDLELLSGANDRKPNKMGEWVFEITGDLYQRLQQWKWQQAQALAFNYIFIPTSVGCRIEVEELSSKEIFDVTAEIEG